MMFVSISYLKQLFMKVTTQLTFNYANSKKETLEKDVKDVQC